jgi:hypothetical protein
MTQQRTEKEQESLDKYGYAMTSDPNGKRQLILTNFNSVSAIPRHPKGLNIRFNDGPMAATGKTHYAVSASREKIERTIAKKGEFTTGGRTTLRRHRTYGVVRDRLAPTPA